MNRVILCLLGLALASETLAQTQNRGIELYKIDNVSARKRNPPPPPPPFYFTNCSNPSISGSFVKGSPTSALLTLTYANGTGSVYPAYTSPTVNGICLTTSAGTLSTSTGSITFSASGTPISAGVMSIPVSIGGSYTCNVGITVLNAPPNQTNCTDPSSTVGSTGCVRFTYRGAQVTYSTVRAGDGRIWIQHNLGAPQVAVNGNDMGSFGHYFQWGRWDDGAQVPNSGTLTGGAALQNPSHIASGNPNFIKGISSSTSWWGTGGAASDTWSSTTATATNGKDPCVALGSGWHMPSAADWQNLINQEFIFDNVSAFASNLRLTESGYRTSSNGVVQANWVGGYYWTSDAASGNTAKNYFFDASYPTPIVITDRGYGFNVRCIK